MSRRLKRILFCPDAHVPYHDERAWRLFLNVGRAFKPDILVVMGDLADFYSVSSHSKDPRRIKELDWEVAEVRKALDQLDALNASEKIFIEGNHCDRLRRYLQDRAPELFGIVSIPTLFGLKERGWTFVPYKRYTKLGKLHLTHDVDNSGRYAAFKALDTFQHSNVTGHTHRLCYVVEGNAVGEHKLSAQFGWLGDIERVDYMHRIKAEKDWALGFGVGYLDPSSGIAYLTPVPLVRYTACVEGKVYRG